MTRIAVCEFLPGWVWAGNVISYPWRGELVFGRVSSPKGKAI